MDHTKFLRESVDNLIIEDKNNADAAFRKYINMKTISVLEKVLDVNTIKDMKKMKDKKNKGMKDSTEC